ncbi:MAG: UDP-N-acetylmuramoyl-L-alanine--D-glutamate ligase [Planctomycetaceae bacterium]
MTLLSLNSSYRGLPVTVMGLGRFSGGVSVARFFAERGARVTVTDLRDETVLSDSLAELKDVPIHRYVLGQHTDDCFSDCRLLVVNPAVKPDNAWVSSAIAHGAEITTEIDVFLQHQSATVIAVTGSNGKSTTTALIHHLLTLSYQGVRTWLGGNIGISLLDQIPNIRSEDVIVLEVSSFQLELLRKKRFRPHIAVLTNFSPNHLDWHGTVDHYRRAKQGIFDAQLSTDFSIVPADIDPQEWKIRGQRLEFGRSDIGDDGAFLSEGQLILRRNRRKLEEAVRLAVPTQLPGGHNHENVAAACLAAWLAGAMPETFAGSLRTFQPLPHRLQCVAEGAGRQFWNDSIATTPESALHAVMHFSKRCIVLAGGYDKGQDLSEFAAALRTHAKAVVLMGQTASQLAEFLRDDSTMTTVPIAVASDFQEAFQRAVALSQSGDIVLLSPGCASYGWFTDYRERGEKFESMAKEWSNQRCQ